MSLLAWGENLSAPLVRLFGWKSVFLRSLWLMRCRRSMYSCCFACRGHCWQARHTRHLQAVGMHSQCRQMHMPACLPHH